jgi:Peroxidase
MLLRTIFVLVALAATSVNSLRVSMSGDLRQPHSPRDILKRDVGRTMSLITRGLVVTSSAALLKPQSSVAKVFFDTDTYGDKELKIAAVNAIKQRLRNAILDDVSIAPDLLKLAINDALDYDVSTSAGGPEGSIQFEMDREENKSLKKAADVLQAIKKDLKRTKTVSYSDLVAFGGAVALETAGSPRITVQVGRFDAKKEGSKDSKIVNWSNPEADAIISAFDTSGLSAREVVLLLGALGELTRVVDETLATAKSNAEDEDDFGIDGPDPASSLPDTFGARDEIYGKKMGKADLSSKYLSGLLKRMKKPSGEPLDAIGSALIANEKTRTYIQKYAGNDSLFIKELGDVYQKLTALGQAGTSRNS